MFTKVFSALTKDDASIAGGKGASLGEMMQAGIPVPPGFVVTAETFDAFIREQDIAQEIAAILDTVDTDAVHTVDKASERIQALILTAKMPEDIAREIQKNFTAMDTEFVAVRSSATAEDGADHAWAGQLDSFLNTTGETLLDNVKKCWASLYTPRAIFYRFEKGMHTEHISVAVVVQKMVNSEKSGIAFSVHPVTEDRNQMIIEAGYGLGEAIVSGQITPDSYVVSKRDLPHEAAIVDVNVAEQSKALYRKEGGGNEWRDLGVAGTEQVLDNQEITKLAQLIVKIENHYGFPCDIEWACEDDKFYITQSRPITTLSDVSQKNTPVSTEGVVQQFKEVLGQDEVLIIRSNFIPFFVITDWLVFYDDAFAKKITVCPTVVFTEDDAVTFYFSAERYKESSRLAVRNFLARSTYIDDVQERFHRVEEEVNALYDAYMAKERGVWEEGDLMRFLQKASHYLSEVVALSIFVDFLDESVVREVYKSANVRLDFEKCIRISTIGDFISFDVRRDMLCMEEREKGARYLRYLFTGYTTFPTEGEVQSAIDNIDVSAMRTRIHNVQEKVRENVRTKKREMAHITAQERELITFLSWAMKLRDDRRFVISKIDTLFAETVQGLYKLWGIDEKLFAVSYTFDVLRGKEFCLQNVDVLKKRQQGFINLYLGGDAYSEEYDSVPEKVALLKELERHDDDNLIKGHTAYKGNVRGRVRIVHSVDDSKAFRAGEILVTGMTRQELVPLIKKAGAIVTEEGGITCHAAIVSRELGKPCIIGTKVATQVLHDGDLVEVDADNGVVRILERAGG